MWHLEWKIIFTTCFSLSAEVSSEYSMDRAMVEFAKMDRELNHYVKAVQSTINHVSLFHFPEYLFTALCSRNENKIRNQNSFSSLISPCPY